ncbi:hypothetical protein [Bradyrhizobium sp. JYMT SZCCT0428]|uniref:hypothetical protein n=1 Tax=Bradyrhizobium sp. JYMT SZCCT0428 TaxID=2807673 RepID=UPI001BAE3669|nr:hypothetical protein [Bradyrhizobium sp. JYMT SZCCT0428]MBR1149344.1 hypothetical protein [Bradyrhizobium sp. JYMT SZCCT0428]
MNVVATITRIFSERVSEASAIAFGVAKPDGLIAAERELLEINAKNSEALARLRQISERVDFQKVGEDLLGSEHDALEAERGKLNCEVESRRHRSSALHRQIATIMPDHARALGLALAPSRRRAAERLIKAVDLAEEALRAIGDSNKILSEAGLSPPRSFPVPYSDAMKGLAGKILKET